jgi:hypothetical protein
MSHPQDDQADRIDGAFALMLEEESPPPLTRTTVSITERVRRMEILGATADFERRFREAYQDRAPAAIVHVPRELPIFEEPVAPQEARTLEELLSDMKPLAFDELVFAGPAVSPFAPAPQPPRPSAPPAAPSNWLSGFFSPDAYRAGVQLQAEMHPEMTTAEALLLTGGGVVALGATAWGDARQAAQVRRVGALDALVAAMPTAKQRLEVTQAATAALVEEGVLDEGHAVAELAERAADADHEERAEHEARVESLDERERQLALGELRGVGAVALASVGVANQAAANANQGAANANQGAQNANVATMASVEQQKMSFAERQEMRREHNMKLREMRAEKDAARDAEHQALAAQANATMSARIDGLAMALGQRQQAPAALPAATVDSGAADALRAAAAAIREE